MYRLRLATEEDYDFLYDLLKAVMKNYYIDTYGSWEEEIERNFFNESFNTLRYQIIACEGRNVGCVAVIRNDSGIFINEIQILPEYQNKGIVKMILDSVISDSGKLEIPICLEVLKVNKKAQRFYERMDFKIRGETETHYVMSRIPKVPVADGGTDQAGK